MDVSISEYLKDGRVLASREITPNERTNLTDRITLGQGPNTWQRNDYNGYRHIQLTVRGARKPLTIRKIGTVERRYRFQQEATFRSSNATLDRIFSGSKWTHRVNSHWGYCGSAWREHAQWSDLAWPAMNLVVFSDPPMMRYYLRQIALGQNSEGRMQFPYPGNLGTELPEQTMWLADDWGSFLDDGASVYWELWNIPGEDVHPIPGYTKEMGARTITYSSGPAPYIVNHILGVQPLKTGFVETLIAPHYSGLSFADGQAPTPMGPVHIRWQRSHETNETSVFVRVPEGAKVVMRVPYEKAQPEVKLNSQRFYDGARFYPISGIANPIREHDQLQFQIEHGFYCLQTGSLNE